MKYGALSTAAGSVIVCWNLLGAPSPRLHFEWREEGGLVVKPPHRRGFGSRLIESSFHIEPGDKVDLSYYPEGVKLTLEFSLSSLQSTDLDR